MADGKFCVFCVFLSASRWYRDPGLMRVVFSFPFLWYFDQTPFTGNLNCFLCSNQLARCHSERSEESFCVKPNGDEATHHKQKDLTNPMILHFVQGSIRSHTVAAKCLLSFSLQLTIAELLKICYIADRLCQLSGGDSRWVSVSL